MAVEVRQGSPGLVCTAAPCRVSLALLVLPSCRAVQVTLYTPLTCQVKQMFLVLKALVIVKAKMDGFPGWMDIIWEFVLEVRVGIFSYQRKKFISFDSSLLRASFLY